MSVSGIGLYVAGAGLICCLMLAQSSRNYIYNSTSRIFCAVNLVMFFVLIYRIYEDIGLFVIAMFLVCSIASGVLFGLISRINDSEIMYRTQSVQGIAIIALTAASFHLS